MDTMTLKLTSAQVTRILDALDMMVASDSDIDDENEVQETRTLIKAIEGQWEAP